MSLKIEVHIDVAESVQRGKPAKGRTVLALDESQLAALPEADRQTIASYLRTDGRYDGSGADAHLSTPSYSNSPPTLPEASLAGMLEGIRDDAARREKEAKEKAAHEAKEKADRREKTLAVLSARKTEAKSHTVYAWRAADKVLTAHDWSKVPGSPIPCGRAECVEMRASWPYPADADAMASPESVEWLSEMEAANVIARQKAEADATAHLAELEAKATAEREAKVSAAAERDAWIAAHGSRRLKRMVEEGIECQAAYADERLALERPGWAWETRVNGEGSDPRNPPDKAFDLLDEARKVDEEAALVFWQDAHEHDDDCDGDCPKYDWQGYAATANFLGREIVFGVSESCKF